MSPLSSSASCLSLTSSGSIQQSSGFVLESFPSVCLSVRPAMYPLSVPQWELPT